MFIGLISGTSADGIDAVLAELEPAPRVVHALTMPYPDDIKQAVDRARDPACALSAAEFALLDAGLGDVFAAAAQTLMRAAGVEPGQVRAIGSHGQTISHQPDANPPATWQLGDPHRIAAITGMVTVADFRRADMAAGGQGAPLAPLIHQVLFHSPDEDRAVLNLGGIANLTWLPASGTVRAFDTGPANCLLDLWYRRHHGGLFDSAGRWGASGKVSDDLLQTLLDDPYFHRSPPKSTGIEQFGAGWLDGRLATFDLPPADVQATLAELTVVTIAREMERQPPARLLVAGGGVHNDDLMRRLGEGLAPLPVESTATAGVAPDFIEALLFAWLAERCLAGEAVDTRGITGAARSVKLGTICAV